MPHPVPLDFFLNALGVPEEDRVLPLQRVLGSGHLVEIRSQRGRHFLCGLVHEFPLEPDDPLLESLIEEPFQTGDTGFLAYEPSSGQLLYWSEILPPSDPHAAPRPDLPSFLRELTELSKKVSLAGGL
jgi:hypothetical protein